MTTLSMPSTPGFISVTWGITANTQIFESPLTKSTQRLRLTGERWTATFKFPPIKLRATVAAWESFFAQLEGRANAFYATPPFRDSPQGIATGTPVVSGANQTGSSLVTSGWTANKTGIIKQGDYLQSADTGQLFIATSTVNSNGSGVATIPIKPQIRTPPTNGTLLYVNNPQVAMILTDDSISWDANAFGVFQFSFSGIEVF